MRIRVVTSVRVTPIGDGASVLEVTTSDGRACAQRRLEAPSPTIQHAALRLAQYYDLTEIPSRAGRISGAIFWATA